MSVVAPLPGTDVYVTVATPHDLDNPEFPHGKIAGNLAALIARLPEKCREYGGTSTSTMAPLDLATARYLGVLTTEQMENHARLAQESRSVREAAREQDERARTEQKVQATNALLSDFRKGARITGSQLEELLELTGIRTAPGTIGTIRKNLISVQVQGDGRISAVGRRSKPTFAVTQLAYQLYKG